MIISFHFSSLKNFSDLYIGERFIEILASHQLFITKSNEYEPVNKEFSEELFGKIWNPDYATGEAQSCDFLFKGNRHQNFRGMIMWNRYLRPNTIWAKIWFNSIHLHITYPRKISTKDIVKIGDDLFEWSEAAHGYITANGMRGNNLSDGLPELMWINYYGEPYISLPDFHMPENAVRVHKGFRFQLTEAPKDEKLSDPAFMDGIKKEMGYEYFKSQPSNTPLDNFGILPTDSKLVRMEKISNGEVYNVKIPAFDKSEIIKPE